MENSDQDIRKINFSFKVQYKYGPKVLPWAWILSSSSSVKVHSELLPMVLVSTSQPACYICFEYISDLIRYELSYRLHLTPGTVHAS
jgi:hypothetical protein